MKSNTCLKQTAQIIQFPMDKKKTSSKSNPSRVSHERPHEPVQPIKDPKDIALAKEYFKSLPQTRDNARNYMMFVININNATRISDLLSLKIEDVLTPEDEIVSEVYIRESKTGKTRYIFFGEQSKAAIRYYLDTIVYYKRSDALFSSLKLNPDGSRKAISRQQAWNIMHKLGEVLSEKTNKNIHLGTHSMRKTFGYQKIKQHNDDPMIVAQISEMYNHSNMNTTYRYLGMDTESKRKLCIEQEL